MTVLRAVLLVAGIVAAVGVPTIEFQTNVTEVVEEVPIGRRVLPPAPAPVPAPGPADCGNFMWDAGSADDLFCKLGTVQEWGMVVCYILNVLLALVTYFLVPVIWVGPKYLLSNCFAVDLTQLKFCKRDYFRLPVALLGPLFFELDALYIFFEIIYGYFMNYGFGKSEAAEAGSGSSLVNGTGANTKFNQGFPKIGPGDCRSSKYARVQTNAC